MLKFGLFCLFLSITVFISPCFAVDDYFPDEKILVDKCAQNFSSSCAKKLAKVRFNHARELFVYLQKTDNMDSFELPLAYAESAVELDTKNSLYWSLLGEFYTLIPHTEFQVMAEGAFLKAIKFDKSNNAARLLLADLMFNEGRFSVSTQLILDAFDRDRKLLTHELVEILSLAYLLDNNVKNGLEVLRQLDKKYDQPFIEAFIAVFEEAI